MDRRFAVGFGAITEEVVRTLEERGQLSALAGVLVRRSQLDAALDGNPKNVNVGATVALAGLGLDRTRVKMVSDPDASGPLGIIEAAGDFGTFRFDILAYASPHNPKTSLLTAHSIIVAALDGVSFHA